MVAIDYTSLQLINTKTSLVCSWFVFKDLDYYTMEVDSPDGTYVIQSKLKLEFLITTRSFEIIAGMVLLLGLMAIIFILLHHVHVTLLPLYITLISTSFSI
jgi:hypothetical protein